MPSTSEKQARTMAAAAHDPKLAKRMDIPHKVAKDFNKADQKSGLLKRAEPKKSMKRQP